MSDIREKSSTYSVIGTDTPSSNSVPILAPGIGTRISEAAQMLGSRRNAASVMGISSAALQRYVSEDNMPPFDAIARLCAAAKVRMEWVAFDLKPIVKQSMRLRGSETLPESQSQPMGHAQAKVEPDLISKAVQIADGVLTKYGIRDQANSEQFGELVRAVYRDLTHGRSEDEAAAALTRIIDIARKPLDGGV